MVSFPCKDGIRFYYNNVYRRALARRMRDAAIPEDVPYHKKRLQRADVLGLGILLNGAVVRAL